MTRLSERNLITDLGFADPDLDEARHDRATHYLSTPEGAAQLAERFKPEPKTMMGQNGRKSVSRFVFKHIGEHIAFERVLSNGNTGQYYKHIGFFDLVLPLYYNEVQDAEDASTRDVTQRIVGEHYLPLIIEVKIWPVTSSELLKQVNLYDGYLRSQIGGTLIDLQGYRFVVATAFDLEPYQMDMLAQMNIDVFRLGNEFEVGLNRTDKPAFPSRFRPATIG